MVKKKKKTSKRSSSNASHTSSGELVSGQLSIKLPVAAQDLLSRLRRAYEIKHLDEITLTQLGRKFLIAGAQAAANGELRDQLAQVDHEILDEIEEGNDE